MSLIRNATHTKNTTINAPRTPPRTPYLIALLRAVQGGYIPPAEISESEYERIKEDRDADRALSGFAGFACSFGGKFFGGYAHNARGTNFAEIGRRTLLRDMKTLRRAEILCGDYRDVEIPPHSVVYADPPYAGTEGYLGERFDSDAFWEHMRKLTAAGNTVFISEENAPSDFEAIWEREQVRTLSLKKKDQKAVIEKLFTLRR